MTGYDVALFDLDGTLTDSKIGITKSVQYALSKFNIREDNLDNLESFIGPPLSESFQKHYGFELTQAQDAVDFYREYFSTSGMYENAVYPGIPDLLAGLKSKGKELIVATSKPTVFANQILNAFNLHQHFTAVVGSHLDGTRTSKTEIIAHALSTLDKSTENGVVMIGDREHDIIGAQGNAIDSIAVTYGYGSLLELQRANPTYLVHAVEDIGALTS
ncbi:phosphoglycolate phosphatase [Candidatus Poribacteria bacterium]|nr:MAG: phosphoglycolate phosphatase [Candidatus Poribacteria bacterium]